MPSSLPTVAILGRPNVGKSTLFNRLLSKKRSVTTPIPGTTRDRIEADTEWNRVRFTLVDTAGIEGEAEAELEDDVEAQIAHAETHADVLVFVVDISAGVVGTERTIAKRLQRLQKPVLLVANKADSVRVRQQATQETRRLGLGEPLVVSAISGSGSGDILDAIATTLQEHAHSTEEHVLEEGAERERSLRLGLFGRPNVGKSTLLNTLLGEERAIVSPISGTTRDSIDARIETEKGPITLVDTAGIRRKAKIKRASIDEWVTKESLQMLRRCDIACLLVDAAEPITAQDRRLANRALEEGVGLLLIVNKWDLVRARREDDEDGDEVFKAFQKTVQRSFPFLRHIPIVTMSAKDGRSVSQLLPLVWTVHANRSRRLSKEDCQEALTYVIKKYGRPNNEKGDGIEFDYLRQAEGVPPLFVLKTKRLKDTVPRAYTHLIEKMLREQHDFRGVSLRVQRY